MHYLMLIQIDEVAFGPRQTPELQAAQSGWTKALIRDGVFVAADRLRPPKTARTLRRSGGRTMCIDGPFVETKEHLGGYYLVDLPDPDAALARAKAMPVSAHCPVFVLPIDGAELHARSGERPPAQTLLMFYGPAPARPQHPDLRSWVPLDGDATLRPLRAGSALEPLPVRVALVDGDLERARAVAEKALAEDGVVELRPVVLYD